MKKIKKENINKAVTSLTTQVTPLAKSVKVEFLDGEMVSLYHTATGTRLVTSIENYLEKMDEYIKVLS